MLQFGSRGLNGAESQEKNNKTEVENKMLQQFNFLLKNQVNRVIGVMSMFYIGLNCLFTFDGNFCNSKNLVEPWTHVIIVAIISAFVIAVCYQLITMISISPDEQYIHLLSICINCMGIYSHISNLSQSQMCIDAFGVVSFIGKWPDRLLYLPFMVYILFAFDSKDALSKTEFGFTIAIFFVVFFEFSLNLGPPRQLAVVMMVFSALSIFAFLWHCMKISMSLNTIVDVSAKNSTIAKLVARFARIMKLGSLRILCATVPTYYMLYTFTAINILDESQSYVTLSLIDALTKLAVTQTTIHAHIKIMEFARQCVLLEQRANEAKRNYLRYVFHDVRVPLNSISMGLSLMETLPGLTKSDLEIFRMMQDACVFMSNTLNDVLSMEKIEAGAMSLDLAAFCLADMVNHVIMSVQGQASAKELRITVTTSHDVPERVIGGNNS